eukprot:CAMPEP_0173385258 /NCGR_PEP_ID=MMETSP1356-20130122/7864_1 /TAXON_ID=77927 ORGANISM="Hemiselmis virescens, Strain PCC157" /NCGR_SAMPLE_ID=MMETSP1356 /ASSEMBLY_ACC=CAM_ASM_000847 /LENGTH=614 /DNA_ID=CAMNT_0014340977 /DNA_START=77 /DNA_END=1921 /DNA_ORIENTATION=-
MSMRFVLVCLAVLELAYGRHFQYGSVSFRQNGPNTIEFHVFTQWKRSYGTFSTFKGSGADGRAITGDVVDMFGVENSDTGVANPVAFFAGDGTSYSLKMTVTHHSEVDDTLYGVSNVTHIYESPNDGDADWLPFLKGCCRESGGNFIVTARVNMLRQQESLAIKGLPIMSYPLSGTPYQIPLPANTPGGLVGSLWRRGAGTEIGGATPPPTSAVFFSSQGSTNGNLTVRTDLLGVSRVPLTVMVASIGSVVPYDFILDVHADREIPTFVGLPLQTNLTSLAQDYIPTLSGYVGYPFLFSVTATTARNASVVTDIRSFRLPSGAVLQNQQQSGDPYQGTSTMKVDFAWTPFPNQAGTHYVCFEAVQWAFPPSPYAPKLPPSTQHCVIIFLESVNPAPEFTVPAEGTIVQFSLASAGSFQIGGFNQNPYDTLTLTPNETLRFGQELSPPVITEGKVLATDTAPRVEAFATFSWTPGASYGAYEQDVCFVLSQRGGGGLTPFSSTRCVRLVVLRCRYVVRDGDSFESIAQLFSTDWLTLWGLNINVTTFVPPVGQTIVIGREYQASDGDTLLTISKQLGSSLDRLRALNFDLAGGGGADRALKAGQFVCTQPDTCTS